jgi:uncharacterized protein YhbP (UPF0306 family)
MKTKTRVKDLAEHIRQYLDDGKLMQVATQSSNGMWLCHVWYAYSPDLKEIVFTSNKSRQHSMDIQDNPSVSAGAVAIPLEGLGQKVRGLTFSGNAHEAQVQDEIESAYMLYKERWPKVESMFSLQDIITKATPMRMYILRPDKYSLWDEVNYPDAPQQQLTFSTRESRQ